ncbi:MAG: ABC transporter substrate-binding protein, partial [Thermomicrobiaceae bacterium]|nr:ABC transporter substrate-binding protein [Thermomicrobiaceae bacterium]
LVPASANDFTPFAQQAKQAKPDLLFVAWAGTTAGAMWQALDQQGAFEVTKVVTGLDIRASYPVFGPVAEKIQFLSHYFYQAPDNDANAFLVAELKKQGKVPDLFHPDGFTAAQMVARAVEQADGDDVEAMIGALEGWSFDGVKGQYTVRKEDHAMLQPMFQAKLVKTGDAYEPELVTTLPPDKVAPPVKPFSS